MMNEFKRMQKLAGLITESEYQEAANIMDMAKSAHLDALKKELNSSDLDNWHITAASNANGIEITSTNQLQNFTTEHDDKGNVVDTYLYKIQRKPSSQKSLSITPAQEKEFLDRIKNIDSVNLEMDAANVLARVLTNDEAEFIEDVEDFGFDPEAVENLAQELVSNVNESQLNEEVYGGQSVDRGETGSSIEFEVKENTPEYYTIDYTITPNSKYSSRSASRNYVRTKKSGTARIKKDYDAPQKEWITVQGDSFLIGKQFAKEIFGDKAD